MSKARALLTICLTLLLASCSSGPDGKPANSQSTNNSTTTAPNNATTSANNGMTSANNIAPNIVDPNVDTACLNNVVPPICPDWHAEVASCDGRPHCVTAESCGIEILCAPDLTPQVYTTVCDRFQDFCEPASPCGFDEDCVLVPSGDFCGCLECPSDAIVQAREAGYLELLNTERARCESVAQCGDAPCIEHLPHCDLQTNACVGRQSKYVTTTGLPNDCQVDADCVAVFQGEVCDACMCPNTAIPARLLDTYQSAFDVDCAHNIACDCPSVEAACAAGTCELTTL